MVGAEVVVIRHLFLVAKQALSGGRLSKALGKFTRWLITAVEGGGNIVSCCNPYILCSFFSVAIGAYIVVLR